ncbi:MULTISPECIES: bacteriocin-like protein [Chryseobacterium]|uniref:bacteriocin-like protein n=1 Tax=Chryseobacterium TaxID=59732 RepID=UPI00397988A5
MKNPNLKKISRQEQKEIKGSGVIKRCFEHFECPGGSCCHNVCVLYPCPLE